MTIGTDMRLIFPRWRRGARIRAVKRYASKLSVSIKEGLGSVLAFAGLLVSRSSRAPRLAVDMNPMDKVVYAALSTPMKKKWWK